MKIIKDTRFMNTNFDVIQRLKNREIELNFVNTFKAMSNFTKHRDVVNERKGRIFNAMDCYTR